MNKKKCKNIPGGIRTHDFRISPPQAGQEYKNDTLSHCVTGMLLGTATQLYFIFFFVGFVLFALK